MVFIGKGDRKPPKQVDMGNSGLYIGVGGNPDGKASVWELSKGNAWRRVGVNGIYGSWKSEYPMATHHTVRMEYVYRMIEYAGALVVGFGDRPGIAQVWMYRPSMARKSTR